MPTVNDLTFYQLSTILNSLVAQATGTAALTATTTADFTSIGTTAIKGGLDPMYNALAQMLGRTIFANRPYSRKFKGAEASEQRWGYITRKISIGDNTFENDDQYALTDGQSVDPWVVKKSKLVEEKFYGQNVWQDHVTIPTVQLRAAFTNPGDFAQLLDLLTTNMQDRMEQATEDAARAALANMIGGVLSGANTSNQVVHLLTEYNTATGQTLTINDVMLGPVYANFMRWVYGRMASISDYLTERSTKYHTSLTGYTINRHTPIEDQRLYIYSPARHMINSSVLATTFHDRYLEQPYTESVNFWQSINTPDSINVTPAYLAANGTITTAGAAVTQSDVFAVLCDRDAWGITLFDESVLASPLNPRGNYYQMFYHRCNRYWNSFTENFIVFLLD